MPFSSQMDKQTWCIRRTKKYSVQVSSFLKTPCLRLPPPGDYVTPTFMSLRPREAPAPQGGQDVTFFVTSSP